MNSTGLSQQCHELSAEVHGGDWPEVLRLVADVERHGVEPGQLLGSVELSLLVFSDASRYTGLREH